MEKTKPLLEIRNLEIMNDEGAKAIVKSISTSVAVRCWVWLGIAGCGQKELCEAIAGLRPIVAVRWFTRGQHWDSPKAIIEKGIAGFIPEDRLGMGLAPPSPSQTI